MANSNSKNNNKGNQTPGSKERKSDSKQSNELPEQNNPRPPKRRSGNSGKPSSPKEQPGSGGTNHNWNSIISDNINDIDWYAKSPELLMDSASISWFRPLGDPLHLMDRANDGVSPTNSAMPSVPGVMVFDTTPIPGYASNNADAVNIAARAIYGDVRWVNSGSANYDPADLMMYILMMDNCYSWIAYLRRVYKELLVASQYNKYMPRVYITAEGIDYEDMIMHISDLRWFINAMQVRLSALVIPGNLPYFRRHLYLYSNVFGDANNQKAQCFKFRPGGYYSWDEQSNPGKLIWTSFNWHTSTRDLTYEDIVTLTTNMLNSVMTSEDLGIMSGDILKAYGDNIFRMEPLLPEEFITPVFNVELLDQIQNLTVFPKLNAFEITQVADATDLRAGAIICKPTFDYTFKEQIPYAWECDKIFNVENPDPNPAQTMILSRLSGAAHPATVYGEAGRVIDVIGTEIITGAYIYYYNGNQVSKMMLPAWVSLRTYNDLDLYRGWMQMSFVRAFDRHPSFITFTSLLNTAPYMILDADLEFSNYTQCSVEVLKKMHESAILSLFNVPAIGTARNQLK